MARIFLSAGHGGFENGQRDPGSVTPTTTEAAEMKKLRDQIAPELRSRGFDVAVVGDDLSAEQTLEWINARCKLSDVALEIHAGSFSNPAARGAIVYYIANNDARKTHAELMLLALLRRLPQLPSRGVKPDTAAGTGSLAFCRRINCPSLQMEVGFISNPEDLALIQNRRDDMALGLADGLASWSRAVTSNTPSVEGQFPPIHISLNGGLYGEQGIIINNNSYIPIDLVDQLDLDLASHADVRRVRYRNVVYIRAVDLRDFNISVGWDGKSRTVLLKSQVALQICPGLIDRIMGHGNVSELQLMRFLESNNDKALNDAALAKLPKLYREEAAIEGVNYDVAFAQMCLETSFLQFDDELTRQQNNFGGIGGVGGSTEPLSFPYEEIGVRAHIQHLKAYGSNEPLVQDLVDPRFRFVRRGVAPLVGQLSGRWDPDKDYGTKVMAILRRLYEQANLL